MGKIAYCLAILATICGCSSETHTNSIRQTPDALVIDTSHFKLTAPGAWRTEEPGPSDVVYRATSETPPLHRQLIISTHALKSGLTQEQRKAAFQDMIELRAKGEKDATQGQINLIPESIHEKDGVLIGGYVGVHPVANRVVFSRDQCDHTNEFNVYYEIWGFQKPPDLEALASDFEKMMSTSTVK